jgi:hypothetical protein
MRRYGVVLFLVVFIFLLNGGTERGAAQQLPPLPADLVFTASTIEGEGDFPRDIILRVDAETYEIFPFYVDHEAFEVLPISWSPTGDLLAIYRILPPLDDSFTVFPRQMCILNREGVLQRCLEDDPPLHYGGDVASWDYYYPVAWGSDGQTFIYQTEYPNKASEYGYGRRLVEANLITGDTRVLYDYSDPYPIYPSSTLRYVIVGFGGIWGGPSDPAFLIDRVTGTRLDISTTVPALTKLYKACMPLSPNDKYITVSASYDLATYAPDQDPSLDTQAMGLLVILDTQGTIRHVIGEPDGINTLWAQDCPGWSPDEKAIFFWATNLEYKAFIMRYSLVDEQLDVLYEVKEWSKQEYSIYPPFIVAPDGEHIALAVAEIPDNKPQVAVLYPDGEIRRIPSPYRFGLYPLWVPPLAE